MPEQIHQLKEEIQALRDEVACLKKQKPKPKIGPSKMDGKKKKRGKSRKRKKKTPLKVDATQTVKAADVPSGSEFKGYADFYVQELIIKSVTTCCRREQWLTPDGRTLKAKLDFESAAPHFGPTLCSFVLYQYYHAQVTEPLILEELRGIPEERHVRIATEGVLLGAVLRHEINPELVIVSDDAGQFNVCCMLCAGFTPSAYWQNLPQA